MIDTFSSILDTGLTFGSTWGALPTHAQNGRRGLGLDPFASCLKATSPMEQQRLL